MERKDFLENFASQFDETDVSLIQFETIFKDIDEWSSLLALSIIAMADEEYNVKLKGDDIKNSHTVEDLYDLVASRQ